MSHFLQSAQANAPSPTAQARGISSHNSIDSTSATNLVTHPCGRRDVAKHPHRVGIRCHSPPTFAIIAGIDTSLDPGPPMSDATRILSAIEQGEGRVASCTIAAVVPSGDPNSLIRISVKHPCPSLPWPHIRRKSEIG